MCRAPAAAAPTKAAVVKRPGTSEGIPLFSLILATSLVWVASFLYFMYFFNLLIHWIFVLASDTIKNAHAKPGENLLERYARAPSHEGLTVCFLQSEERNGEGETRGHCPGQETLSPPKPWNSLVATHSFSPLSCSKFVFLFPPHSLFC